MNDIVNFSEFEPIAALIKSAHANPVKGEYFFEIYMSTNHIFEHEKIIAIFREDAEFNFVAGKISTLTGTIRDEKLGQFLWNLFLR